MITPSAMENIYQSFAYCSIGCLRHGGGGRSLFLCIREKKKKRLKLVKKENENKRDILFTYVICKHYKDVIITQGH